jgi:hypothetical protein
MKKKHNTFVEHYLVPIALFVLNICLVHVVYLFAAGTVYSVTAKVTMTLTLILMGASLVFKKKSLLAGAVLLYAIVAILI